jgi:hypothetical protein
MSGSQRVVSVQGATEVAYTTFQPAPSAAAQSASTSSSANAVKASKSRMTWGYWFVRGMFKLVIRLFM